MLLNEQLLKNKSRVYYHGTINRNSEDAIPNFPWLSITTNFMYAVCYARKCNTDFGIIKKFVINRTIDVFNARCFSDLEKLHDSLGVSKALWSRIEPIIRDKDWVLLGEKLRQKIIQTLKSLGYDGFFNFECTEQSPYLMDFGIRGNYEKSASFGIFNTDCLTEIGVLERKDFERESLTFETQHNDEIEYAIKKIPSLLDEGMLEDDVKLEVYDLCPTLTWSELEEVYLKAEAEDDDDDDWDDFFSDVYTESIKQH